MTNDDCLPFSGPWEKLLKVESRETHTRMVPRPFSAELARVVKLKVTVMLVNDCTLFPWMQGKEMRIAHIEAEARALNGKEVTTVTYAPADDANGVELAYQKTLNALHKVVYPMPESCEWEAKIRRVEEAMAQ